MANEEQPLDPRIAAVLAESQLLRELATKAETREDFLSLVKKYNPNVRIPEIDGPAQIREKAVKPLEERLAAMEKTMAERDGSALLKSQRDAIRGQGVDDADVPEVEKLMTERKIGDPTIAADWYLRNKAAAEPRSYQSSVVDFPDAKELWSGPAGAKNWSRRMAEQILAKRA